MGYIVHAILDTCKHIVTKNIFRDQSTPSHFLGGSPHLQFTFRLSLCEIWAVIKAPAAWVLQEMNNYPGYPVIYQDYNQPLPILKLTYIAPENRPSPKKEFSSSNHHLSGAKKKLHNQGIVGCTPIPTYPYWKSLYKPYLGGGFIFFIFTPIWGRFPIWLIFFRWVETTNQLLYVGYLWVIIPKNP